MRPCSNSPRGARGKMEPHNLAVETQKPGEQKWLSTAAHVAISAAAADLRARPLKLVVEEGCNGLRG